MHARITWEPFCAAFDCRAPLVPMLGACDIPARVIQRGSNTYVPSMNMHTCTTGGDDSDSSQDAKKGRLKYNVEDLKEIAAKTGSFEMLVINFPHNPTGACISTTELREVASVANAHDAWLFSDEMYRGLGAKKQNPHAAIITLFLIGMY